MLTSRLTLATAHTSLTAPSTSMLAHTFILLYHCLSVQNILPLFVPCPTATSFKALQPHLAQEDLLWDPGPITLEPVCLSGPEFFENRNCTLSLLASPKCLQWLVQIWDLTLCHVSQQKSVKTSVYHTINLSRAFFGPDWAMSSEGFTFFPWDLSSFSPSKYDYVSASPLLLIPSLA